MNQDKILQISGKTLRQAQADSVTRYYPHYIQNTCYNVSYNVGNIKASHA